jgi:hypothetical protein
LLRRCKTFKNAHFELQKRPFATIAALSIVGNGNLPPTGCMA